MFWNRKNLIIILIVCLILFFCMYKDNSIKKEETIQTNGTPVSFHTVILDAGHGKPDRSEQLLVMELQKNK